MENKYTSIFWNLANAYRGIMMPETLTPAVIRLVFIKYVTDNYLFAESRDEMVHYADMQKCIASRDVNGFLNSVMPILEMIDKKVGTDGILVNSYSSYSNDLVGGFYKKKTFSSETSERIIAVLSDSDFSEQEEECGSVFEALKDYVYSSMIRSGRYGAENITNTSVSKLVNRLLDVQETDSYMDFACGYGLSSLEIAGEKSKQLLLSDINDECVQITTMLLIIQGDSIKKASITCQNVFDSNDAIQKATKAFVDFPLACRIDRNKYLYSDGVILAAHKLIDSLQEGGRAIITTAASLLFRTNKETKDFRKYLLDNSLLEAVITLPPVIPGSTVNVSLLVLSKNNNKSILLMDTSSNTAFQFSNNARTFNTELIDSGIEKIAEVFTKKEEISGISKIVEMTEIMEKNTLVPMAYITAPKVGTQISSEEIRNKLDDLYKKLYEFNKLS